MNNKVVPGHVLTLDDNITCTNTTPVIVSGFRSEYLRSYSYISLQVQFGYVAAQTSLVFTITRATGLQYRDGRDKKIQTNPYCKVYLLPDRRSVNIYIYILSSRRR